MSPVASQILANFRMTWIIPDDHAPALLEPRRIRHRCGRQRVCGADLIHPEYRPVAAGSALLLHEPIDDVSHVSAILAVAEVFERRKAIERERLVALELTGDDLPRILLGRLGEGTYRGVTQTPKAMHIWWATPPNGT